MLTRNVRSSCKRPPPASFCCRLLATDASTSTTRTTSSNASIPQKKVPRPRINVGIILNRSPIITRSPSVFEKTYYAYQVRIRRALHNPFQTDFYFKSGSPLEAQFSAEERKRERQAFGAPFGTVEEDVGEVAKDVNTGEPQAEQREGDSEKIMPRRHKADQQNDVRSLDRQGQRNLYLLLLQKDPTRPQWRFPQGAVEKGDVLHGVAQRDLHKECGEFMDTWIVARNPIGVYESQPSGPSLAVPQRSLTFFLKAHILAGQVRPNSETIQDFAWLTKEEIQTRVEPDYWAAVGDILADF